MECSRAAQRKQPKGQSPISALPGSVTATAAVPRCPLRLCPQALPMSTERKNWDMGMFKMGAERFRNQFGVMGNSLRNNKKKNKQLLFSSTCQKKCSTSFLLLQQQ